MTRNGAPGAAEDAVARAGDILEAACGGRLSRDRRLAPLTSFRIGGPADLYLEPEGDRDLEAVSRVVRETGVPIAMLGKGSNVLVADAGFRGLVVRLGAAFRWVKAEGDRLSAGAAMPLPTLAGSALRASLTGLEFGVAIPASLGGAVRMNAGAHGQEIADVVRWIDVFRLDRADRETIVAEEAGFGYRRSELPESAAIVGATFQLTAGESSAIRSQMDEARAWRRATQPLAEPNCGSVFKNPSNDHAARLVESSGAKGLRVGGATVSSKHANFIVAAEGTRAADVVALIQQVQELVKLRTGIELERELHLIGSFERARV